MKNNKQKKWIIIVTIVSIVYINGILSIMKIYTKWKKYTSFEYNISEITNHKITLLSPLKDNTIYRSEFGEGEDFHILDYEEDSINKIIETNYFEKITEENIEEVNQILKRYQDDLCEKERKLFDKTITISELSVIGNYYRYLQLADEDDYFVFIIFPNKNKLYSFHINH